MMNQLKRRQPAASAKKCEVNQLSLFKKKKISFISTVDESINSRYSRRRRRSVDGAGTKKFSRKLQLKIQQIRRRARYGMSCDDISLDVITISRWLSADEVKRERRSDVVLRISR
ncbi:hypothetical protein F511_42278 [Dorcoceras hygrometricum]|uniref:Uncharacterized protein n=1 Tax=Dorcoceras hygrometricum TaxID=472368 RepID=A0A2Z7AMQ1_9LAMI|nr:hypothetical protein F511_42278 [Dorcoceras hygrometricum]